MSARTKQLTAAAVAGLVFGIGLLVSGMAQPSKVVGFLDIAGPWDSSLIWVMVSGIATYSIAYRLALRRRQPLFGTSFGAPPPAAIDLKLLCGAALFGLGWGLGGYCPGPALVSLATGSADALGFVAAMSIGMAAVELVERAAQKRLQDNLSQP